MRTLIIKTGSLGDVVRTTTVLKELKDQEVHWITSRGAKELLPSEAIFRSYDYENLPVDFFLTKFDRALSLEENSCCLDILRRADPKKIIGIYLNKNEIDYTSESSHWFDMSLSSKFGKNEADRRKKQNRKSVPEMLVNMLDKEFVGQEYDIGVAQNNFPSYDVGIINICGKEWPNKTWPRYSELKKILEADGMRVATLDTRPSLTEHIQDVNNCRVIVSGDTLGMHLALALKKKTVTLFTCTPPHEIEGYGLMKKIISPRYEEFFMARGYCREAADAISVDEVYMAVRDSLK